MKWVNQLCGLNQGIFVVKYVAVYSEYGTLTLCFHLMTGFQINLLRKLAECHLTTGFPINPLHRQMDH